MEFVSKFEPEVIKEILSDWTESDLGDADYYFYPPTVSILRCPIRRLLSGIANDSLNDHLAVLKKIGETILIVEGNLEPDSSSPPRVNGTNFYYAAVQAYLLSLQRQGIMVFYSQYPRSSALIVKSLRNHYNVKEHRLLRRRPSPLFDVGPEVQLLTLLPGVDVKLAEDLLDEYGNLYNVLAAILAGKVKELDDKVLTKIVELFYGSTGPRE